ncbi:carotene biosynthesis protein [Mongoliitalea daihaiensis]|uniref:carotene biosynthesis protein n=1 Tax=Mongoliitalea daihaiensis TaxID=2782006 RepID=UPI001F444B07|nr:carotene biosynthesis protein [Mongoliitalea daihaiensis]UJP64790.1 carotene biosynthesis protein [Mongoliitalea daihaiensis]
MKVFVNWISPIFFLIILMGMAYGLERTDAWALQVCYAILFGLFLFSYWRSQEIGFVRLLVIGCLSRLLLIPHTPFLSDDFYRFLFDGHLILQGINPYTYLPQEALQQVSENSLSYMSLLVEQMNSSSYFSIYPPLHQVFFVGAALGGQSLVWNLILLRLPLILVDMGVLFFLWKLLPLWNQDRSKVLLYWLNPLIILELTGNVHFEGLVLLGLLGSIWFFKTSKPMTSASLWGFAIGVKLLPAIMGAVWLRVFPPLKHTRFWLTFTFICLIVLFPLFQADTFHNFYQSFRLYQSSFEFNASLYYVLRFLSSFWLDYNPIGTLGPVLNFLAIIGMLFFAWRQPKPIDLATGFVGTYGIYLVVQTTVHPWYIIPMLGLSLLTRYSSPLLWSALVFLSYTAYTSDPTEELTLLLLVQYIPLLIFAAKELFDPNQDIPETP